MARLFDKTNNDFLDAGNPSALNLTGDEVTLVARIRIATLNGEQKILAKWSDAGGDFQYLLALNSDDKLLFAINAGGISITIATTTSVTGIWCHVAGTYDASDMRIYLEGIEENSISKTGNMPSTTAPVRIGAGSGGSGTEQPFDGDIGHVAIYGVGLTADEISSLAAGVSPPKIRADDLLFYAPLNGQDPEYDIIGGVSLTVNGAVKSEEPPIPNSIVAP